MHLHTEEGPESGQIWAQGQMKQDYWPEETQKDCPHTKDLNHSLPLLLFCLSLSPSTPITTIGESLSVLSPIFCLFSLNTLFASLLSVFCSQIRPPKGQVQVLGTYIKRLGFSILAPQLPKNTVMKNFAWRVLSCINPCNNSNSTQGCFQTTV